MFFLIRKVNQTVIPANHIINPVNTESPMSLVFYQTELTSVVIRVVNKNKRAEYINSKTGRIIPSKKWTEEMQAFYENQSMHISPGIKKIKITIGGYLFILLILLAVGILIWDTLKPKKQIVSANMDEKVKTGNVYYGRFQEMTPAGVPIRDGYAWFRIKAIQGDTVLVNLGKETTKESGQDEKLSSTDFLDSSYKTTIRSQKNYEIDFRTKNSEMMFSAQKRK